MLYRNYQLNKTHSALKFGRANGYPLVLSNAKSTPVRKLEVSGNSYQATRGKNLWDGENIVQGVGTTNYNPPALNSLIKGQTYTLIAFIDNTKNNESSISTRLSVGYGSPNAYRYIYSNNIPAGSTGYAIITTQIPDDHNNGRINYQFSPGKDGEFTASNFMLLEGTYTADTMPEYEPYVKKPSPDHPSEVLSVGELNNNVTRKAGFSSRYTFPYKWSEVSKIVLTAKVMLKKSGQQILFCSHGSDWIGCSGTDYSNNKWNYTSGFFSPTATLSPTEFFNGDINTIEFSFTNTSEEYITDMWDKVWNTNDITFYRIQFYNGDILLGDYYPIELYSMYDSISGTSIIPDSNDGYANFISNYRIPIECRGRNLFDVSQSKGFTSQYGGLTNVIEGNTITVTCSADSRLGYLTLGSFPAGKYYVSVGTNSSSTPRMQINGKIVPGLSANNVITLTEDSNLVALYEGFTKKTFIYTDIQITKSDTAIPYEPYYHDTVNVYTDKPLYGIDDYTDSITLDFEKKKAVRIDKIQEVNITEPYKPSPVYKVINDHVLFNYRNADTTGNGVPGSPMLSNILENAVVSAMTESERIWHHTSLSTNLYFSLNKARFGYEDGDDSTVLYEKCKDYLSENPLIAYYVRLEPIETDISDTINWDKLLHLSRHTNILSSSTTISPLNLYVKYVRK